MPGVWFQEFLVGGRLAFPSVPSSTICRFAMCWCKFHYNKNEKAVLANIYCAFTMCQGFYMHYLI